VPVYVSAFAGTHFAYPQRDGQAEFAWVALVDPAKTVGLNEVPFGRDRLHGFKPLLIDFF